MADLPLRGDRWLYGATAATNRFTSRTESVRADLEQGMEFHWSAGLPGGSETVAVLHLAISA
ncbi:hypothetical protein [Streptomyces longisporus]|uniref:Uncharacterized protein n=1 Tax=Streptomyces longisporus TaxID=1948 RepID=A0ABN3N5H2_STRLO